MGAQSVGNLAIIISGNASQYNKATKDAINSTNALKASFGGGAGIAAFAGGFLGTIMGTGLSSITPGFSAITSGFQQIGTAAIQSAMDYETAQAQFGVMLGDAQKGAEMVKRIQELAIATPYDSGTLNDITRQLLGMGVVGESTLPTLKALGELAGGDAERFKRLALAFGQVTAKGQFMGGELLQFAEAGIGATDFAKAAGMSVSEFRAKMEAGAIGADVMAKAINQLTGEGGRFHGMMSVMSDTTQGKWNALKESFVSGLGVLGAGFLKGVGANELLTQGSDFAERMKSWGEQARQFGSAVRETFDQGRAWVSAFVDTFTSRMESFLGPKSKMPFDSYKDGLKAMLDFGVKALGFLTDAWYRHVSDTIRLIGALTFQMNSYGKIAVSLGLIDAKDLKAVEQARAGLLQIGENIDNYLGSGQSFAWDWSQRFDANLGNAAKQAQKVKENLQDAKAAAVLGGIGAIPIAPSVPADVAKFAQDFKNSMAKGVGPMGEFRAQMRLISGAEQWGQLDKNQSGQAMAKAFSGIEQQFGKLFEFSLPKAMERGSSGAFSTINRAISRGVSDPQKRVADILQAALTEERNTARNTAQTAEALRRLTEQTAGF